MSIEDKILDHLATLSKDVGRIEGIVNRNTDLIDGIRNSCFTCLEKIPLMERGINNHLATHDKFMKYLWFPLAVIGIVALAGFLLKVLFHIW